jgi:hypothetical protein
VAVLRLSKPEQIDNPCSGGLNQRGQMPVSPFERRPRFSVEDHNVFASEIFECSLDVIRSLNETDVTLISADWKFRHLLPGDGTSNLHGERLALAWD